MTTIVTANMLNAFLDFLDGQLALDTCATMVWKSGDVKEWLMIEEGPTLDPKDMVDLIPEVIATLKATYGSYENSRNLSTINIIDNMLTAHWLYQVNQELVLMNEPTLSDIHMNKQIGVSLTNIKMSNLCQYWRLNACKCANNGKQCNMKHEDCEYKAYCPLGSSNCARRHHEIVGNNHGICSTFLKYKICTIHNCQFDHPTYMLSALYSNV
jgi:hypothetical protein